MSKNDVPFHRVLQNFVENMQLPAEVGVNGLSYSYGGSNINFDTNATYPIVSVPLAPLRNAQFTAYSNFCPCNASSASSRRSSSKKRSSLSRNQGPYSVLQLRPSLRLSFPSGGNTCSYLSCPHPSRNILRRLCRSSLGSHPPWSTTLSRQTY